MPAEAMQAAV